MAESQAKLLKILVMASCKNWFQALSSELLLGQTPLLWGENLASLSISLYNLLKIVH